MEKIVIGETGERLSQPRKASTCGATILVAATWLLIGMDPNPARAETLRWKFKAGEVLHYSIEQKMVMSAKAMGQERKSSRSQTLDIRWTVNRVDGDGTAEITLRFDRVRVRNEVPPLMPFVLDTNEANAPAQPGFEAETQQLKAIVGAEVVFKIHPTGEMEDVKVPEATLKKMRDAAPRGSADAEVSEKALKEMLLQSSPPSFPDGDIEPGKTWSSKPAKMPIGFATMVLDKTFTFQGPDSKAPGRLLIGMETKVLLEPAAGADVKATIRKQEGRGTMSFDVETGHLAGARMTQKLEMVLSAGGQSIEQSQDTTTTMTLEP
ncbi:MAG: hypothetical protein ACLQGP_16210 [Isosphaeraceae bacterium]